MNRSQAGEEPEPWTEHSRSLGSYYRSIPTCYNLQDPLEHTSWLVTGSGLVLFCLLGE